MKPDDPKFKALVADILSRPKLEGGAPKPSKRKAKRTRKPRET